MLADVAVVDTVVHAARDAVVHREPRGIPSVEPSARVIAKRRVDRLIRRDVESIGDVDDRRDRVWLHGRPPESALDLRNDQGASAPPGDREQIRSIEHDRSVCQHAFLDVAPEVRHLLVGIVEQDVAPSALGDLVAPALEGLAQHRRQPGVHEVERREHVDRADVWWRRVVRDPRETLRERPRDPGIAKCQMRLREGADRPRLPEGAARVRGRTVFVDRPVPTADEVMEAPVAALHEQNEVEKPSSPLPQPVVAGLTPEVEEEDDRSRRVVDTRDTLEALVTRREGEVVTVGVDRDRAGARARRRERPGQARELSKRGGIPPGLRGSR